MPSLRRAAATQLLRANAAGRRQGVDERRRRRRHILVLVQLESLGCVHREVEGAQRHPVLGADERRIERQLGVFEPVFDFVFELAGAAGLVVDELEATAAIDDVDAVHEAVQLDAAERCRRCTQLDFSARP
jgi:hypothetical protein